MREDVNLASVITIVLIVIMMLLTREEGNTEITDRFAVNIIYNWLAYGKLWTGPNQTPRHTCMGAIMCANK